MIKTCIVYIEIALVCTSPPIVRKASHDGVTYQSEFSQGTILTYTCETGLKFQNGSDGKSITCGKNGRWSEIESKCEGRYLVLLIKSNK